MNMKTYTINFSTMKLFRILILASLSAATVFGADQPPMAITNWQRVDFPRLSFSIPPGMTNVPVRGIDTQVGRCASTNMSLLFQFVRISGMEPNEPSTPVQVGGRAAKLVIRPLGSGESPWERAAGNTNYVLLSVPNVTSQTMGGNSLRMSIFYRDPKDLPVAKAIVDSIHFEAEPGGASNSRRAGQ
jgi:hypothetical protein